MRSHQPFCSARRAVLVALGLLLFLSPAGCAHQAICDAIQDRDHDRLQSLLERDINPNGRCWGANSQTSLMLAVRYGEESTVRRLLALGASVDVGDGDGRTALMYASGLPLGRFAGRPSQEKIVALLEHGADVNASDHRGQTALMYAARTGMVESVKRLIENGADVHAITVAGDTALHESVVRKAEITEVLLAAGANVHVKNQAGSTPLMHAVYAHSDEQIQAIKLLLSSGADPNVHNTRGQSVLALARKVAKTHYFPEVEKILLAAGAQ